MVYVRIPETLQGSDREGTLEKILRIGLGVLILKANPGFEHKLHLVHTGYENLRMLDLPGKEDGVERKREGRHEGALSKALWIPDP